MSAGRSLDRLAGKTALITGAARGMGEAHAQLFAREGAKVILTDVLDDEGDAVAQELRAGGHDAAYRHLDVSSAEAWAGAVRFADDAFGGIDVLVNNAGVVSHSPVAETTDAEWERVVGVNQRGVFLGMREVIPSMVRRDGGSIVNISSVWGLRGSTGSLAYHATKAAVIGMTKSAALTHAGDRIRVNAVCPGPILTPMLEAEDPEAVRALLEVIPMRRGAQPDEVSRGVLYLASDDASFVTGAVLVIDGGMIAG
jgi:NAD(P)-dependent dehydrogenase (short-subunit alcohol dehydrogenase family)